MQEGREGLAKRWFTNKMSEKEKIIELDKMKKKVVTEKDSSIPP